MPIDSVHAVWLGAVTLFGLCVGSFLNVVIYRLPEEISVVQPRSFCPSCKHGIAWYDNVPVVSWLVLGGHCRHCHKTISPRYALVELLTAALFVGFYLWLGWSAHLLVLWTLTACLVASTFIDFDYRIIPDEITLPGMVLGLVVSALVPAIHGVASPWLGLRQSILGILVGGGSLYLTGLLGNAIFRKESMGGGDVKLLAMAGSVLGWKLVLLAFFLAPLLALLPGLIVLFTTKSHEIPYGPFLSLALVIAMVSGDRILERSGVVQALDVGMPELWRYVASWWQGNGARP